MELMNKEKDEFEFLKESGYQYHRSKKLNSMSLKNFLETLEKRIVDQACKDDAAKEIELVDRFIALVEEEKDLVSASHPPIPNCSEFDLVPGEDPLRD